MWWKDTWCWLWLLCLLQAKYSLLPYLVTLWLKYLFIMSKSQFSGGSAAPSLWGDPSFKPSPKWTNCYERWIKITLALWVEGDSSGHAGGHMDGMHSSVWMVLARLQGALFPLHLCKMACLEAPSPKLWEWCPQNCLIHWPLSGTQHSPEKTAGGRELLSSCVCVYFMCTSRD